MLWILITLFFCWLIYNELNTDLPKSKLYLTVLLSLALSCSWPPIHFWYFEHKLNSIAILLSENPSTRVHCNTLFDTVFDEDPGVGGHTDYTDDYIVIQYPLCSTLMDYLNHPYKANIDELTSLNILTHESMHARGEHDESKTECESVQRNFRTAKLLGVPDYIAKENAIAYYKEVYLKRKTGPYFSEQCAPGKDMDEQLTDSIWNN